MIQRDCPIERVSPRDAPAPGAPVQHFFFGYYDKCPWSADESALLAHRVSFLARVPGPEDFADVGTIDPRAPERRFVPLARTRAWNWQQGAQLQWLRDPAAGGIEHVLYNDRDERGRALARIVTRAGVPVRDLPLPVYAVAPSNADAVTLNFHRLALLRPEYGYAGLAGPASAELPPAPGDDGVWRLDLRTGAAALLVSLRELVDHRPSPFAPPGAQHSVNHLMFNPSGTRFCFMHRFMREGGIQHSRLFTLAIDGTGLRLLFEGFCSHYDWWDDSTIVAWAGTRKLLGASAAGGFSPKALLRRVLKPIYHALGKPRFLMSRVMGDRYMAIADRAPEPGENSTVLPDRIAAGELTTDGHCTFSRPRVAGADQSARARFMLTDGYPDLASRQPVYIWDAARGVTTRIGLFQTPRELDGPIRVDLHPRFNRAATKVCIDSAMDGTRAIYELDVCAIVAADSPAAPDARQNASLPLSAISPGAS